MQISYGSVEAMVTEYLSRRCVSVKLMLKVLFPLAKKILVSVKEDLNCVEKDEYLEGFGGGFGANYCQDFGKI